MHMHADIDTHPMALAVRSLRQALTQHARERLAQTDRQRPIDPLDQCRFEQLVEIDAALSRLLSEHPRQARVFECRWFGGLDEEQTAQALGLPSETVRRDWGMGREWLRRQLGDTRTML